MTEERHKLTCEMVDLHNMLRPYAFMGLAQEIGNEDALRYGLGYYELLEKNLTWVVSRMHFVIRRPAMWRDEVLLRTQSRGVVGPFFVRDYVLLDPADPAAGPFVQGTSSWVLLDVRERKLVRNDVLGDTALAGHGMLAGALEEPAPRVAFPRKAERTPAGSRRVRYSDLDHNGHTNNATYILWALDCLPPEVTLENWCREVSINFSRETRPGEEVTLSYVGTADAETGARTFFVEGEEGESVIFTARLVF